MGLLSEAIRKMALAGQGLGVGSNDRVPMTSTQIGVSPVPGDQGDEAGHRRRLDMAGQDCTQPVESRLGETTAVMDRLLSLDPSPLPSIATTPAPTGSHPGPAQGPRATPAGHRRPVREE